MQYIPPQVIVAAPIIFNLENLHSKIKSIEQGKLLFNCGRRNKPTRPFRR